MPKYKAEHLRHLADYQTNRNLTKPDEMSWRDYIIMLLHIGGELEHGLMVQYLYSAYSLGGEGLPPEEEERVRNWQDLILTVAREEMGHLLTVQNILCLVGGPVSFSRHEFPWDTPFYPFPFMLEPFSKDTLAGYVFAEMPGNFAFLESHYAETIAGQNARHFIEHDIPFIKEVVKKWVEGRETHPVGEVYQKIIDILSNPDCIRDSDLRPETYPLQASWDDWGRSYGPKPASPNGQTPKPDNHKANVLIERAATRTEALYALRELAGQGEAAELKHTKVSRGRIPPSPDSERSHFERFVKIYEEFEMPHPKDWNPVLPVPTNPSTTLPVTGTDRSRFPLTPITAKVSLKWAKLFNVRYRMLLTYLTHTFRLARVVSPDEPNTRGAVMAKIFGEMYNIKTIASLLVRLPLTDDAGDKRRAGPPFEMPYTLELPLDEIDCWLLHRDIVLSSMELCEELLHPASDGVSVTLRAGDPKHAPLRVSKDDPAQAPIAGEQYLRALRNHDQNALIWIDTVLAGLRGAMKGSRP
jgi:hypothetical protein